MLPANAASTHQNKLTADKTSTKSATAPSLRVCSFTFRDRSKQNGIANWPTTSSSATHCQPSRNRRKYQGVSSGRFSDQISKNWENDRYAHIITKVSSKLPRSRRRLSVNVCEKGDTRLSKHSVRTPKAMPA